MAERSGHGNILNFTGEWHKPPEMPSDLWDIQGASQALGAEVFEDIDPGTGESFDVLLLMQSPLVDPKGVIAVPSLDIRRALKSITYWDGTDPDEGTIFEDVTSFVVDVENGLLSIRAKTPHYDSSLIIPRDGPIEIIKKPIVTRVEPLSSAERATVFQRYYRAEAKARADVIIASSSR